MAQDSNNPVALNAILTKLAEVYSSCATYEDQGAVTTTMPDESGHEEITVDFFTTAFERKTERFRYEFRTGSPAAKLDLGCVAWGHRGLAKIWTAISASIETVDNLGLAVAGATGNSGEPAFLVPNLLATKEIGGRGLLELDDLRIAGETKFNNCDCLGISGAYSPGSQLTVWVEINSALILRAETETAMSLEVSPKFHGIVIGSGPLMTKTVITYSPRVNTIIPEEKFALLVPGGIV